jgi:molecular chaperone Hsp33
MIQHLPKPGTAAPQRDLDPGDVPEGVAAPDDADEHEDWAEARALVATVEAHELTDPLLASNRLLLRLFHERGVRAFQAERIEEACRCSRQRIAEMLAQFSEDDLAAMVKDDRIEVTCEFCSTAYDFDPADVG